MAFNPFGYTNSMLMSARTVMLKLSLCLCARTRAHTDKHTRAHTLPKFLYRPGSRGLKERGWGLLAGEEFVISHQIIHLTGSCYSRSSHFTKSFRTCKQLIHSCCGAVTFYCCLFDLSTVREIYQFMLQGI